MLVKQGYSEKAIVQLQQGLAEQRSSGEGVGQTSTLVMLAEAYGATGRIEDGLSKIDEALVLVDKLDERYYESELHRLRGELLLQQFPNNSAEAESCFQNGLSVARSQQAKSWELRAATSLARLWQSQGKCQVAYDLLQPVYGWFTEGFDTADLKEAKALLRELEV